MYTFLCIPIETHQSSFRSAKFTQRGCTVCATYVDGLRFLSGNGSLPVKSTGCESLSISYHGGCITSPKNISKGACANVCVCVWLTTNGVVLRHQVLSPVDEDRGQTHVS